MLDWIKDKFYYRKKYNTLKIKYATSEQAWTKVIIELGRQNTEYQTEIDSVKNRLRISNEKRKEQRDRLKILEK